jgi:hypothetical protein
MGAKTPDILERERAGGSARSIPVPQPAFRPLLRIGAASRSELPLRMAEAYRVSQRLQKTFDNPAALCYAGS